MRFESLFKNCRFGWNNFHKVPDMHWRQLPNAYSAKALRFNSLTFLFANCFTRILSKSIRSFDPPTSN
ncbi:hypothetical protein L2E82_51980 [Cichorium intybus]|nr:hypothetical protein L2E82_51980 [Cichorium intybus]